MEAAPRRETFDEMWAKGITVEEFRQSCYELIEEIYADK